LTDSAPLKFKNAAYPFISAATTVEATKVTYIPMRHAEPNEPDIPTVKAAWLAALDEEQSPAVSSRPGLWRHAPVAVAVMGHLVASHEARLPDADLDQFPPPPTAHHRQPPPARECP
jgi:hypothetical protein